LSDLLHALRRVSWTRSSATDTEPDSEIANARRFDISATSSSLKLAGGIGVFLRLLLYVLKFLLLLFFLEPSQQVEQLLGKGSVDEIVVMRLQRSPDRFQNLRIECSVVQRRFLHRS